MKKLMSVILNEEGKCISLAVCKNLDEETIKALQNEVNENKVKSNQKEQELLSRLDKLEEENKKLKKEILFLKGEE